RPEPRDMIRTLFHGKADYERARRKDAIPPIVAQKAAELTAEVILAVTRAPVALSAAGFRDTDFETGHVQTAVANRYWLDGDETDPRRADARKALAPLAAAARLAASELDEAHRRMVDYAVVSEGGFPAYLGGPIAFGLGRAP
ncbi:hypothetical protein LTR94_031540, partial [Friedmanniomyces endolithicus]